MASIRRVERRLTPLKSSIKKPRNNGYQEWKSPFDPDKTMTECLKEEKEKLFSKAEK